MVLWKYKLQYSRLKLILLHSGYGLLLIALIFLGWSPNHWPLTLLIIGWTLVERHISIRKEKAQQNIFVTLKKEGQWQWGDQAGLQWRLTYWLPLAIQFQLIDKNGRSQYKWLIKDAVTEDAWQVLRLCRDKWRGSITGRDKIFRQGFARTSGKYVHHLKKID